MKAQEEQGEDANSLHGEPRVEQTHDMVAQRMVGPCGQRPTLTDARPSKSVASSHESRAGSARHGKGRRGRKGETGARENRENRKQHLARRLPLSHHNNKYNTHNSGSGSSICSRHDATPVTPRPETPSS